LRKLIITTPDGMYIEGVNATRNYYYFELDNIIELANRKSESLTRNFIIYYDNKVILEETLTVNDNLKEQIKNKMKKNSKDSIKYLNEIKENIKFTTELKEFLIKYDEQLGINTKKPFPFSLDIYKMKKIFDYVYESTGKHIYLELNNIIKTLDGLYNYLLVEANLNEKRFHEFMNNEKDFQKVCDYIPTKLMSIDAHRIDTTYPALNEYHKMQDALFKELPFYMSFNECMQLQNRFIEDIYNEYHNKMFNNKTVESTEVLQQEVIIPVINQYHENIKNTLKKFNHYNTGG